VIKEQVDVEVPLADLEMNLTSDEREAGAQLQQELRDVRDERGLELALLGLGAEREEVEAVGSFNVSRARSDCGLGNRCSKFVTALPSRSKVRSSMWCVSSGRDQPCSTARAA
jgi:hypothetical protein